MDSSTWKKIKSSGTYRRKIQNYRLSFKRHRILSKPSSAILSASEASLMIEGRDHVAEENSANSGENVFNLSEENPLSSHPEHNHSNGSEYSNFSTEVASDDDDNKNNCDDMNSDDEDDFLKFLRKWAIDFKIPHTAIKPLME